MQFRRLFLSQLLAAGSVTAGLLPAVRGAAQSAGDAPQEFVGIDGWLNTPAPLSIAGLRGKVVLVDFWTYSCINCRRTVPYLNRWQAEYGAQGLQVVGIHTPEFRFEHTRHNVEHAVREFGIHFPVGQDNEFRTWQSWGNEAWPAFYLLDRDGRVVLVRLGEDHAHELESAIRALLDLAPSSAPIVAADDPDLSRIGTPEIYFGAVHPTPQDPSQRPQQGEAVYAFPAKGPKSGEYQLDGTWLRQGEALVLRSPRGGVRTRFSAAKLHLVASAPQPATVRVTVDDGASQAIEVERPTLYTLFDGTRYVEHTMSFVCETPGLSLFSATFG
jgi:thiol-disulfide isomerase/thioredoxin